MRTENTATMRGAITRGKQKRTQVEYALIVVTFCAILLAIVILARAIHGHHFVDNGTRQVTQYAAVRGGPTFQSFPNGHFPLRSGMIA
jgi:hypothetical protein